MLALRTHRKPTTVTMTTARTAGTTRHMALRWSTQRIQIALIALLVVSTIGGNDAVDLGKWIKLNFLFSPFFAHRK